jgi:uncharacterized protein DUF5666
MSTIGFRKIAAILSILLAVSGCGGGGDMVAGGGTGGTGVSFGTVTDFGSIFVNGVEFSTNGATIRRDDISISENELRKGMTVEVQGSISSSTSGVATSVTVEEAVRGPVESKTGTANAGTLIVLGQTVLVDDTTLFDNNVPDFAGISAGNVLEVHGLRRANGDIAASFIERKTAPVVFVVRGTTANHNSGAQTFTVGALTVNYGGAIINDMPAPSGSNWNNLFVEVKGTACAGNPVCGTLTATKVEPEGLGMANATKAEIEGFVTALVSTSDFTVNSQRVVTNGSTVFAGGLQSEIVVGTKLEVEGSLAGGVLTATKVKFKESVRIESNATVTGSTITLDGLPGITVTANAFTEFKSTAATAANLAPLNGRNVRIRGRASGATSVIATEIEDRGPSIPNGDVILQGSASNVSNPTFAILGVTVDTTGLAADKFGDVNDNPVGAAAFFSALSNGVLVKAKGRLPAVNALAAGSLREVELED